MDDIEIKEMGSEHDDQLNDLLISWNLGHVLYNLEDESVTIDVMKIMDYEQLQELTNSWKLGDKAVFIFNFQKWRNEINLPLSLGKVISETSTCLSPQNDPNPSPNSNQIAMFNDENDVLNINVVEILNEHKMGVKIMQIYKINKKLTDDQRNLIISIIAQFFQKKDIPMSLQTSYRLENQILELFATEKLEFYRTERRGKIYTKFSNMKKAAKRSIDEENQPPFKLSKNLHTSDLSKSRFVPEEDAKMMAQSIHYDNLSAEDFKSTWSACSQYRLQQIFYECQNIGEILDIWPQYRKPNGYKLIDKDFKVLNKSYDSIMNWGDKMVNLLKFLKKSKLIRGHDQKLLEDIDIEDAVKDQDKFAFKVLWALHYFLYPTGKYVKKNELGKKIHNRFTTKDSLKSYLYVKPTLQALEEHIESLKKKKESIQPFILGEGSLENITQYYVYFDGTRLPFSNFLRSLDICFKVFHLFNVEYPKPSESFWTFIEKYFFEIDKNSKKISKVSILIENLKK